MKTKGLRDACEPKSSVHIEEPIYETHNIPWKSSEAGRPRDTAPSGAGGGNGHVSHRARKFTLEFPKRETRRSL